MSKDGSTVEPKKEFVKEKMPAIGTHEQLEHIAFFDPEKPMPEPRSLWERYNRVLRFNFMQDGELPSAGQPHRPEMTMWERWTKPFLPLRPETYRDAYLRNNPCPEEFFVQGWRWPLYRAVNPKIPPPTDGKYNDIYHFHAYKWWLRRERDVYIQHCVWLREMLDRCILKEGMTAAAKNCRHVWHKYFAMTRGEELNQNLIYMAVTGNCAIRETPYPADFVDQKRKVYDDWLFRTRMRKPGDPF